MGDKEPKIDGIPDIPVIDSDATGLLLDRYLADCDTPVTDTTDVLELSRHVTDLLGRLAAKDVELGILGQENEELARRNKELEEENTRDPLTGIFNRRYFERELDRLLESDDRDKIEVVALDLNGLKVINDSLGHSKGDDAIVFVARSINAMAREKEFIARIGGDEFVFVALNKDRRINDDILTDTTTEKRKQIEKDRRHEATLNLSGIINRIMKAVGVASTEFRRKLADEGIESDQGLSSCAGSATYDDGDTRKTILARADAMLYQQKELIKGSNQGTSR